MGLETMDWIAREAGEHKAAIRHGGFGEPLMHPDIIGIIEKCKKHDVLTTIFTNCNLLTEDMMRAFVDFGLDEIRFSSSGLTPEEHNGIRRNSNYHEDFERKLEMAHNIREKMNSKLPFLTLYTNVIDYQADNFKENIDSYRQKYIKYADKVDVDLTMFSRVKELEHIKELYESQTINEIHKRCVTLFIKVIVHWNGDVFGCDCAYNFEEDFYIGTIGEGDFSIEKGYLSDKIQKLRKNLSFAMNHDNYSLCRDCYSNTTKWSDEKNK